MLTPEEIKQILILIGRADIKGTEAVPVALLQQKLAKMMDTPKED